MRERERDAILSTSPPQKHAFNFLSSSLLSASSSLFDSKRIEIENEEESWGACDRAMELKMEGKSGRARGDEEMKLGDEEKSWGGGMR